MIDPALTAANLARIQICHHLRRNYILGNEIVVLSWQTLTALLFHLSFQVSKGNVTKMRCSSFDLI